MKASKSPSMGQEELDSRLRLLTSEDFIISHKRALSTLLKVGTRSKSFTQKANVCFGILSIVGIDVKTALDNVGTITLYVNSVIDRLQKWHDQEIQKPQGILATIDSPVRMKVLSALSTLGDEAISGFKAYAEVSPDKAATISVVADTTIGKHLKIAVPKLRGVTTVGNITLPTEPRIVYSTDKAVKPTPHQAETINPMEYIGKSMPPKEFLSKLSLREDTRHGDLLTAQQNKAPTLGQLKNIKKKGTGTIATFLLGKDNSGKEIICTVKIDNQNWKLKGTAAFPVKDRRKTEGIILPLTIGTIKNPTEEYPYTSIRGFIDVATTCKHYSEPQA